MYETFINQVLGGWPEIRCSRGERERERELWPKKWCHDEILRRQQKVICFIATTAERKEEMRAKQMVADWK